MTSSTVRYLRLTGHLLADNTLRLLPGYLTTDPRGSGEDADSPVRVMCLDEEGHTLLHHRASTTRYCLAGEQPPVLAIRATVPIPAATRRVCLFRDDVPVGEIPVRSAGPEVDITWKPSQAVKGRQEIRWRADHPEGCALQAFVRYSSDGGESWERVSGRLDDSSFPIDFDALPGGEHCQVAVIVTDGFHTTVATTPRFAVPSKPGRPVILLPADGATVPEGVSLALHAQRIDGQTGAPLAAQLTWTSSLDGALGEGGVRMARGLSVGTHEIRVAAKEGGSATVTVRVVERVRSAGG